MNKLSILIPALGVLAGNLLLANGLEISSVRLVPVSRRVAQIEMDLAWQNSWRDECNHDAAWLFAKYSIDGGATWKHASLKGPGVAPALTSPGTNTLIELYVPQDGRGAFVRRREPGRGTLATAGLRLAWDLEADDIPPDAQGRLSLHGLEMVYVPEGPFYVGDDASQPYSGFKVTRISTPDVSKTTAAGLGTIAAPYTNLTTGIGRPYGISGTFTNLVDVCLPARLSVDIHGDGIADAFSDKITGVTVSRPGGLGDGGASFTMASDVPLVVPGETLILIR